jgi:nucleoside-diphosphate-sugar epimerase
MQAPAKIAVAGATGTVGRHVVDMLEAEGHDVVGMSRSLGVDVVSGDGLAEALRRAEEPAVCATLAD